MEICGSALSKAFQRCFTHGEKGRGSWLAGSVSIKRSFHLSPVLSGVLSK